MRHAVRLFALLVLAAIAAPGAAWPASFQKAVAREIEWRVEQGHADFGSELDDERLFQVYAFYHDRGYTPMWVRDSGPKTKAWVLLQQLRDAGDRGLDAADYRPEALARLMEATDPPELARLEIELTRAFLAFASDLRSGRVRPGDIDHAVHLAPPGLPASDLIGGAEAADDLGPYLAAIEPSAPHYRRLKAKLAEYRRVAEAGGWPRVPDGPPLAPGASDPRVPALRGFLAAVGDLAPDADAGSDFYDDALTAAVARFQARHGLGADGKLDEATLAEMRVPLETRTAALQLNLERRRWMPDDLGERHLFINLADQYLKLVEHDATVHTELLVVGKPFSRTPVFSDEMEFIVLNPDWTVPEEAARQELMPLLRDDPAALAKRRIRVIEAGRETEARAVNWAEAGRGSVALRQGPGAGNALGRVKFMFPNPYGVYIHDTPERALFARPSRYLSQGALQVAEPLALAEALLDDEAWPRDRLRDAVRGGRKTVLMLDETVPVHVAYLTAWVEKDGEVHFRRDGYGRDAKLARALGLPPPAAR